MSHTANQEPKMVVGETRVASVDFTRKLDSDELLTGTPTVVEVATSDLTISDIAVSSTALKILKKNVAIGKAMQFKVIGALAGIASTAIVAGGTYIIVTAGTTDFTAIGAADNNVGTVFEATGAGTGTGTVDIKYKLLITALTDSTPQQTLKAKVTVIGEAA